MDHIQPMRNGNFRSSFPKDMTWHHVDMPATPQLADFNSYKSQYKIYHPDGAGGVTNGVAEKNAENKGG